MGKEQLVDKINNIVSLKYNHLLYEDDESKLKDIVMDDEINKCLRDLFNDTGSQIEEKKIKELSKNEFLKNILNIYLEMNNIIVVSNDYIINKNETLEEYFEEIEEELEDFDKIYEDITKDSFYSTDTLKQYCYEIKKYPLLTKKEEKELLIKLKNGDKEARQKLIQHNLRYVVSVAYRYSIFGVDILDLIQSGNIGLMNAIDNFDINRNIRLLSYASYHIKKQIYEEIRNKRLIMFPVYIENLLRKILSSKLNDINNVKDDIDIISKEYNIQKDTLLYILTFLTEFISLDSNLNDRDEVNFYEIIKDKNAVNPEECAIKTQQDIEMLKIMSSCLTQKQQEIVKLKYGFEDGIDKDFVECSKILGKTHQAVQRLDSAARVKLKNKILELKYL